MKRKTLTLGLAFVAVFGLFAALPASTTLAKGDKGPGVSGDYEVDADKVGIPEVKANSVLEGVLNTVYFIAGIAAVIVLVIAGILYATSAGDAAKVKQAKDAILYAVVGLVVVIMAFTITGFIMGGIG